MEEHLPESVQILATHPVFGPQSGKDGIAGLPMAVWPVRVNAQAMKSIKKFLSQTLGLDVIEMPPDKHDREMAYALALTHLISRAFNEMDIPQLRLGTKSYKLMLAIKENLSEDSMELFQTIQNYNPYALKVRQKFVKQLDELEAKIETHKSNLN
jgi:prephenate dehydrogenase